jgi:ABC-2 family transporter protein
LLLALGLLFPFAVIVGQISREKQSGQKELMKMMSVQESDIGGSWLCSFIAFHVPTSLLAALASSFLYASSSFGLLWLFWIMALYSVIVFGMFIAACFSKAYQALLIGVSFYLAGILLSIVSSINSISPHLLQLLSVHPMFAFCRGIELLGFLDDHRGLGRHSMTYTEPGSTFDFALVYKSLLTSIIVNGTLCWYLNRKYGLGEGLPWWFPFAPTYWLRPAESFTSFATTPDSGDHSDDNVHARIPVENVGDFHKRQGALGLNIDVINLRKKFGNKSAVDGLTVNFYCGEVTALLGQNGTNSRTRYACPYDLLLITCRCWKDYIAQDSYWLDRTIFGFSHCRWTECER